jgi:hypothetical protein
MHMRAPDFFKTVMEISLTLHEEGCVERVSDASTPNPVR